MWAQCKTFKGQTGGTGGWMVGAAASEYKGATWGIFMWTEEYM